MQLRDYQQRVLDEVWTAIHKQLNALIVAPCSAGKTILFAHLVKMILAKQDGFRALILVDREILVAQSRDKLIAVAPDLADDIGIVCSSISTTHDTTKRVTIASRQSLIGRIKIMQPVQLVIVDEAHLMSMPTEQHPVPDQFGAILSTLREHNPNTRLVGCTASPYRLNVGYIYGDNNKPGSVPYFDKITVEVSTDELLRNGYITRLVGKVRDDPTTIGDLSAVSMVAGEYNLGELSGIMCKEQHVESCVDAWQEHALERKKTLVFCTSIKHCDLVADAFIKRGITAASVHSKLSMQAQQQLMDDMRIGTHRVYTSVAKLTTGMDIADIDCIILARPTKSAALYKQIVGRGQRLAPGKDDCLVLDLVGMVREFGSNMDDLIINVPRGAGNGEPPRKTCPNVLQDGAYCGISMHSSMMICPECGYQFPAEEMIDGGTGPMRDVYFDTQGEPTVYQVDGVHYRVHRNNKSGKSMIKVNYVCGIASVNEYVCLPDYYDGFPVYKAKKWWAARSQDQFPDTLDEFLFLSETINVPRYIAVVKDGKYDKIIKYTFGECDLEDAA